MNSNNTRRLRSAVGAVALLGVLASACGSDEKKSEQTTTTTAAAGGDSTTTAASTGDGPSFIYITPTNIGPNKFLELGKIGTEAAAARLGGTSKTFESTDLNSRRANLEAAVEEKPDIIILTTFDFTDLSAEFAAANPTQQFILIDQCPAEPPANLHCGVFRENEMSYLLGVIAGSLSESGKVGSVVALDIPFLHRFTDNFALGAQSVNADITDSQVFIAGDNPFADPATAKEQALALHAQGVDQIFAAASGSNGGVFEAAQEEDFLAYGTDVNQCALAPGHIVDNALKLVDVLTEQLIDQVLAGTAGSVVSFGLAEGGVGVVALQDDVASSGCLIADHPDVIAAVKTARDAIVAGTIVVPDPVTGG
ncbi:MAG TPA: BMP family ABC transporter substrate-binding protein [Ilumatobacteraceae bacterium]|nr:BMP family ABC transporter substrate-binding protein [Ilumatobacteraceae bacterium]